MNKEWYKIDVRNEILRDVVAFLGDNLLWEEIEEDLRSVSVRNLMDPMYVKNIKGIKDPCAFSQYITDRYIYYRGKKYGQQGFWDAARKEREIGYNGGWYSFITDLLNLYCQPGDKVLFVGTADGSEIPNDYVYQYYALEQLKDSVDCIKKHKFVQCYEADFEDSTFLIGNGHMMSVIVALRCLMPNTRLDRFLRFAVNNMQSSGVLILSHPMSFLNAENEFRPLADSRNSLKSFDIRLKAALLKHGNLHLLCEKETCVEYFCIIRVE